ncbi:MAG: metalloregulator ArsR/SmtB family transcription factor [Nanoarchaeota archaeon]
MPKTQIHTNRRMIDFFSTLADETRLKIIAALMERPRTVNDIHEAIGKYTLTLSAVSHQLRHMADLDIIRYDKNGREKTFHLSDAFCWCIVREALNHYHDEKKCTACKPMRMKE